MHRQSSEKCKGKKPCKLWIFFIHLEEFSWNEDEDFVSNLVVSLWHSTFTKSKPNLPLPCFIPLLAFNYLGFCLQSRGKAASVCSAALCSTWLKTTQRGSRSSRKRRRTVTWAFSSSKSSSRQTRWAFLLPPQPQMTFRSLRRRLKRRSGSNRGDWVEPIGWEKELGEEPEANSWLFALSSPPPEHRHTVQTDTRRFCQISCAEMNHCDANAVHMMLKKKKLKKKRPYYCESILCTFTPWRMRKRVEKRQNEIMNEILHGYLAVMLPWKNRALNSPVGTYYNY